MKRSRLRRLYLALLAAGLLPTPAVIAQLEEVIVTAQKREQSLQDVPMAVSAIGREALQDNEINSVQDLTKLVPSLRFKPGDDSTNDSIRIRGVGTDVFSPAVEPNVSVVVDGVPLARTSLANFDFADLERIEVLRGPQGTLFGKNASAGLIHVISRDPSREEFEAFFRFTHEKPQRFAGDFSKTQFSVSGPLADSIGARFTGFWKQRNGHLRDIEQGKHMPDAAQFGARLKLQWDPTDVLAARLNLEYQRRDAAAGPVVRRSGNPELQERSRPIEFSETNTDTRTFGRNIADTINKAASLTIDWELPQFTISSITGHRSADFVRGQSTPGLNGDRIDLLFQGGPRSVETVTQELRLTSANSDTLEYTAGALWFDNRLIEDFDRMVGDVPAAFVAGTSTPGFLGVIEGELGGTDSIDIIEGIDDVVDTENLGIFGQATWHLADLWHLTVGARYIDESVTVEFFTFQDIFDGATGTRLDLASSSFDGESTTASDTEITGMFSLQYDWKDHSVLYATYAKGYRGAAFDIVVGADQEQLDAPIEPEKANSYEIGIKSRLFDDRLELNITAFLTYFENFQAQILDLENSTSTEIRVANAGELETRGLELEFNTQPAAGLSLYGSILYNRAVFNEFITQCYPGQMAGDKGAIDNDGDGNCDAQNAAGRVLPNAPEFSITVTTRYEYPIGDSQVVFGQLTGRWQDEVQFTSEQHPNTIEDAYQVWDLRCGWTSMTGRVEVAAYIKNLFDQHYVNSIIPLSFDNDPRDTVHSVPVDSQRVFGLSLVYRL